MKQLVDKHCQTYFVPNSTRNIINIPYINFYSAGFSLTRYLFNSWLMYIHTNGENSIGKLICSTPWRLLAQARMIFVESVLRDEYRQLAQKIKYWASNKQCNIRRWTIWRAWRKTKNSSEKRLLRPSLLNRYYLQ